MCREDRLQAGSYPVHVRARTCLEGQNFSRRVAALAGREGAETPPEPRSKCGVPNSFRPRRKLAERVGFESTALTSLRVVERARLTQSCVIFDVSGVRKRQEGFSRTAKAATWGRRECALPITQVEGLAA